MNENFENNVNEYTSDVVSGVEQAPKKKGAKIAAIAAGAVVAVGGGGAVAYNCSDFVKNQVKLATLEPAEYYAWVAEENSEEFSSNLAESYDKYLDALKDGQSASVNFKYEATDAVKELLINEMFGEAASDPEAKEFVDMINNINSIEIGSEAQTKNSLSTGNAYVSVNDDKLASAELSMDASALEYFFRIPELNDKWLGINANDLVEGEEMEGITTSNALLTDLLENPEELISSAEIDELVTRYTGVWAKSIKDVELEKKAEVDICDISVEYTVLTSEIDQKAAKKIAENFIEEASDDKLLKEIITERLEACTKEEYDSTLEEALASIKESEGSESDEKITLITYVDAKGTIRGMGLELPDGESLTYAMGLDGDDVRGELAFDADGESMKAQLTAVKDGKKYDGDIAFEVVAASYDYETGEETTETTKFSVEFTDFEVVDEEKCYLNGEIAIVIPEIDPISFTLASDGKAQDILFNLNIDGADYGTFTLSMAEGKYDDSKAPSTDNAVMITDDFDIESYTNKEEFSALITDILKKLGLSEENAALLGDEAAAAFFEGYNDAEAEDDIIWDDEDFEWDDEDFEWDDEEFPTEDEDIDLDDEDFEYDAELTVAPKEAFICVSDENFAANFYGDEYDTLTATKTAMLDGNGTYTVSVSADDPELAPEGMYILTICANDAAEYADAQFTVESLKIDGKDIALSSNECDVYEYDGIIDAYIYDSWDESGMIDAESIGAWSTIEVTFTVSGF